MAEEITTKEFVSLLWNGLKKNFEISVEEEHLLHFGHIKGWLEDQDERFPESFVDKRTAARIVHSFMQKEFNLKDVKDVSSAEVLKDLYTCRVCTNHVAQIFVRGLMDSEELEVNGEAVVLFNMTRTITKKEALELIEKAAALINI